jgi:hypothetical protein
MEELARTIIARYFLASGETITEAMEGRAAVVVTTTAARWAVEPYTGFPHLAGNGAYRLFDVTPATFSNPRPPRGVCVGADGPLWLLSDPDDLRRWYAAAKPPLDPLELAGLLVRYHGTGGSGHTLIAQMDDLGGLLAPEQIAALPAFTLPAIETPSPGAFAMAFCSLFLARGEADRVWRVNLNRWHVAAAVDEQLAWSLTAIARELDSPRYAPQWLHTE